MLAFLGVGVGLQSRSVPLILVILLNPRPRDELVVLEDQPEFAVVKDADVLCGEFLHLVRFAHQVQHLFRAGAKLNDFRPLLFRRMTDAWHWLR